MLCRVRCITCFNFHHLIIPTLHEKKLGLGKVKQAAHGHTDANGQGRNSNPISLCCQSLGCYCSALTASPGQALSHWLPWPTRPSRKVQAEEQGVRLGTRQAAEAVPPGLWVTLQLFIKFFGPCSRCLPRKALLLGWELGQLCSQNPFCSN